MSSKILTNKAYPVVFLAVIVIVSVVILMALNSVTSSIVEGRRFEEIKDTLEKIFPGMSDYELEDELYMIYQDGEKSGYAFIASGSGYGGDIDILVGLGSDLKIKDISILKQTETPGLGGRITEDTFTGQFKGLSASEVALRSDDGTIDAITGATISSKAVVDTVREKMIEIIESLDN
jgi:RnfABCDGE-type electron transport complex G subunit